MSTELPFVSVIVPVFNDSAHLKNCLQLLEQQTYPKNLYEVIVVDNNSEEDIEAVVSQLTQTVLTFEKKRGSYAARNRGISVAKGEILAFTDSDCIPAINWIEKGVNHLIALPDCGLVAGEINLTFKDPENPTVIELYDKLNFLRQKHYLENLKFGATANLFTFKKVFEDVGLFNAELKSSGDREWGQRVFKSGYKQAYAEDACIDHPARSELREVKRKVARIVEGQYNIENPSRKPLLPFLYEVFLESKPPLKEVQKIFSQDNSQIIDFWRKLRYFLLFVLMRNVRAWKKFQLYFR